MLVKEFIQGPLIQEIEDMTMKDGEPTHPYLGFQLISSSIEFLGACLDSYDWASSGLSEKRFRLAIDKLFSSKYKKYNKKSNKFDLYSNLRCSLVHASRPGNFIGLSERKWGCNGLLEDNKMLKICFEDFLSDFKDACNKLINFIDNRSISGDKVYCHIISTPQD
jgi:hypothetical protein